MRRRTAVLVALLGACALGGRAAAADEPAEVHRIAVLDVPDVGATPSMVRIGDRLVFVGTDYSGGREPWITDGTSAGTRRIVDLQPGTSPSNPDFLGVVGGKVVCKAIVGADGFDLWAVDPDASTAARLTDFGVVPPTVSPAFVVLFASAGARGVFAVVRPWSGDELWTTDGTHEGTRPLPVTPFHESGFFSLGDRVVFFGLDDATNVVPFSTDGTEAGTTQLPGLRATPIDGRTGLVVEGTLFIAGDGGIWATDGVPGHERLVRPTADLRHGSPLMESGGSIFVVDPVRRLVEIDAVAPFGFRTLPFRPGRDPSFFPIALAASGRRVFAAVAGRTADARTVWTSDAGRKPRLVRMKNGRPLPAPFGRVLPLGDSGSVVFVGPPTRGVGDELWISDGSRRGTRLFADVAPGPASSYADPLIVLGDHVLCVAEDANAQVRRLVSVEVKR